MAPSKVVKVKSGAGRLTMVTPLNPVMGSLFSMPHTKSAKKPNAMSTAITKAAFRKNDFGCIQLLNPHKKLTTKCTIPLSAGLSVIASAINSRMSVVRFDIFLQRFFDFIYLRAKNLLTLEESENVYKNNCPGYAECRKKIDAIVHFKFLPSFYSNSCRHDFVDFLDTSL